jgi:hypothetical protein
MLGDRLPGHVETSAELVKRLTVVGMQAIQQLPPAGVRQRLEHRVHQRSKYATIWLPER